MSKIKLFEEQDYKILNEQHDSRRLFIDPQFPATPHSISHTGKLELINDDDENVLNDIEWRRPHEIVDEPHFVIDGFQRKDIGQGLLGDCWFVAAVAALTLHPELISIVIPSHQTFDDEEYTGMFHFRFWLSGYWHDVVIDDRLPCYKARLVFSRNNKNPDEFWAALLEKAYAKVCGSYEVMHGGHVTDGLVNFTGGIDEKIPLLQMERTDESIEKVKQLLFQACENKSMVGAIIFKLDDQSEETILPNGLLSGHAYSVIQMTELNLANETTTLVRCMNPWNNSVEWNGHWSDNSPCWDRISKQEKRKLKFTKSHEGEFWMDINDFFFCFHEIQICHLGPESLCATDTENASAEMPISVWKEKICHGRWETDVSAGGSGLNGQQPEKYWINPQHFIQLLYDDDHSEEIRNMLIIQLVFEDQRRRMLKDVEHVRIAFDLYKIKNQSEIDQHLKENLKFYMTDMEYIDGIRDHQISYSASKRFSVTSGSYIVIPNTSDYNKDGNYTLRFFIEKGADDIIIKDLTTNKEHLTEEDMERLHIKIDAGAFDKSSFPENKNADVPDSKDSEELGDDNQAEKKE